MIGLSARKAGDLVGRCAQLAALLEVSAYPKPGNVHRTRDFLGTRYEHFLAGSVALSPSMSLLAEMGYRVSEGRFSWDKVGLGEGILSAVDESLRWQSGGNVNLGIALLFAPLSAAAGYSLSDFKVESSRLREAVREATQATTSEDAVAVYRAIGRSMTGRVLGRVDELDVGDKSSLDRIRRDGITLIDVFRMSARRDSISREWATGFEITFTQGYPYLAQRVCEKDPNVAIVDTFLQLLSVEPDSLIVRKSGLEEATSVSGKAKEIIEEGGLGSEKGRAKAKALDEELQKAGGALNPGTTADLTASSIFVLLLTGWRL